MNGGIIWDILLQECLWAALWVCLQWHFVRLPSGVTRMSVEKQTADFLYLLCRYMKANPGCIVAVNEHNSVSADKQPLGYCDDTYYYIRPEIYRAAEYPEHKVDMLLILRKLFAMDYIKVHWILTGQVRYRPQKRVGKTRKRYITLYRKQLDNFMNEHFVKEADDEQK